MPITDTLALDWQISPTIPLHHFYVEKGAGEPAPIGTHLEKTAPGYRWTGWSTTYATTSPVGAARSYPTRQSSSREATTQAGTPALSSAGEHASRSVAPPMIFAAGLASILNPAPCSPASQPAPLSNRQQSFWARPEMARMAQEISYAPGCARCLVRHAPGPTPIIPSR